MRTLTWRRQQLRVRVFGRGPSVVLVHNAGADGRVWRPVVEQLAGAYTVWVPDMPGFGRSDYPRIQYNLDAFASAVDTVITAAGGRAAVVGQCVGASAAWRCAQLQPHRIVALGMIHPATWSTVTAGPVGLLHATLRTASVRTNAVRGLSRTIPLWLPTLVRQLSHAQLTEADTEALRDALGRPTTLRVLSSILEHLHTFATLDQFVRPANFPPTWLAWGAKGRLVPLSGLARVVEQLRPAAVIELPKTGHLASLEAPEVLATSLLSFLDDTHER